MHPVPHPTEDPGHAGTLGRTLAGTELALAGCAAVGVVTLALAAAAGRAAALGPGFVVTVAALTAAALGAALLGARAAYGVCRWGPADHVTALRIGLAAIVAALVLEAPRETVAWVAVCASGLALALDGVDGWLARRTGTASRYGARLDMETDAALVLVLCALCWLHGKAGAWVLASGALRYAFVAAARLWPTLDAPLPPSRRRQAVCVIQVAALLACLSPTLGVTMSTPLAAAALALLCWSFAVDVRWLVRREENR